MRILLILLSCYVSCREIETFSEKAQLLKIANDKQTHLSEEEPPEEPSEPTEKPPTKSPPPENPTDEPDTPSDTPADDEDNDEEGLEKKEIILFSIFAVFTFASICLAVYGGVIRNTYLIICFTVTTLCLPLIVTVGYFWIREEISNAEGIAFTSSIGVLAIIFCLTLIYCRKPNTSRTVSRASSYAMTDMKSKSNPYEL